MVRPPPITLILFKKLKNEVFPLFFRSVHQYLLIFGLSTIGGWTFGITLVRPSVRMSVCPSRAISETVRYFFLKLGS